jgi:hypothetical protein
MAENESKLELVENRDAMDLVPTWELEWWWYLVAVGGFVLIGLLAYVVFRKKTVDDPGRMEREAYREAISALASLSEAGGKENVIQVSLIMRAYLAKSMGEPALFETHEEFMGRHDAIKGLSVELRVAISAYFSELAAVKYGSVETGIFDLDGLKERATELLERIHTV